MSNRDWQHVSQVLAALLVVLLAAAAVVVITRPSPGSARPSPTRIAAATPSGSVTPSGSRTAGTSASPGPSGSPALSPTDTLEPSPSPTDMPTDSPTPEITPSPSPTGTPTPSPTIAPTAPSVAIRFIRVGFDSASTIGAMPRTFTFHSEGPGEVAAHLLRTSQGNVHFCLGQKGGTATCRDSTRADLVASTDAPGRITWVVTGIGTDANSPVADVRLTFRTSQPGVTIRDFRFQGLQSANYNGVEAEFDVGTGTVHANGDWAGTQRPWRAVVTDAGTGESLFDGSGLGNNLLVDVGVVPRRVHLSLTNTEDLADQAVFLHAVIQWTGAH